MVYSGIPTVHEWILAYVKLDVYIYVTHDVHTPNPWSINPVVGGRVALGDIVGRDDWILGVLQGMRDGNNYLCSDPRRLGKTSVVRRLVNEPGEKAIALRIDYQGVSSSTEFLLHSVRAMGSLAPLHNKIKATLERLFDGAEITGGQFGVGLRISASQADRQPIDLLHDVLAAIDRTTDEDQLVIFALDEVPIAIQNIARRIDNNGPTEAAHLLQQLRNAREAFGHLRWLITGSVGFHHVLRECKDTTTGVIADLTNLTLGPFDEEHSIFLGQCLALGIDRDLDEAAHTAIAASTGGVPFLIQALFQRIRNAGTSGTITIDEIESAFTSMIDDRDESRAIDHFLTRIDVYFKNDQSAAAYKVLDIIATGQAMSRADAIRTIESIFDNVAGDSAQLLINSLIDDHYLVQSGGTLSWRYDVFRRIWIARRELNS